MVNKKYITLKNNYSKLVELMIEPDAEYIDIQINQTAIIEIISAGNYPELIEIEYDIDLIRLFKGREVKLKISINNEVVFIDE